MQNKKGYENTNTAGKIIVTKEYFDRLYDDFITVDFRDIVFRNLNVLGFDGITVALEIGSYINTRAPLKTAYNCYTFFFYFFL